MAIPRPPPEGCFAVAAASPRMACKHGPAHLLWHFRQQQAGHCQAASCLLPASWLLPVQAEQATRGQVEHASTESCKGWKHTVRTSPTVHLATAADVRVILTAPLHTVQAGRPPAPSSSLSFCAIVCCKPLARHCVCTDHRTLKAAHQDRTGQHTTFPSVPEHCTACVHECGLIGLDA